VSAARRTGLRRAGCGLVLLAALGVSHAAPASELQLVGEAEVLLPGILSRATDEQVATVHPTGSIIVFDCPDCDTGRDPDLWLVQRRGASWVGPGRAKPSSIAREASPAFSSDGAWLYYVSERGGGFGGADLFRAAYASHRDKFFTAENLGASVNSPGEEGGATALAADTGVIFASRGRKGARGWDLFVSRRVDGRLAPAQPLASLNTAADETAPALLPDERGLLFVRDAQAWFAPRRGEGYGQAQRLSAAVNAPGSRVLGVQHAHDTPDQLVFTRAGREGRGDVLRIRYRVVSGEEGDRAADDR
jgi:hypothetical protein